MPDHNPSHAVSPSLAASSDQRRLVARTDPRSIDPTVRWFWLFALLHLSIWTIVPALTQPNAPLDTIEMLYWGHEWQWGYYKHPPLPGWIAEASCCVFGQVAWPTYLMAQFCVIACFWSAWQLAREILKPWHALCAALLLEACYYYNFTTPELNNNVVSRTFWALAILCFYRALTRQQLRWWLLIGVSLAMGMLSKYDTAVLAATMIGFLVLHPVGRRSWAAAGPYVTIVAGLTLFAPHLYWLVTNDFPTIHYFQRRSASDATWVNHLLNPLKFLRSQVPAFAPLALLAIPLVARWTPRRVGHDERFQRDFLWSMVVGPVAMILVASAVAGFSVRAMWGTALWTYSGVFLLFLLPLREGLPAAKRLVPLCVAATVLFATALAVRNTVSPFVRQKGSRVHYPGRQLAAEVDRRWRHHYQEPLRLVAGTWWEAANVAFYGEQRASVFADLDPTTSPWTSDQVLRESGGVILWDSGVDPQQMLDELKARFPTAHVETPIEVDWETTANLRPVKVGIAIVPPSASGTSRRY